MNGLGYVERYRLSVDKALEAGLSECMVDGVPHIRIPYYLPSGEVRGYQRRRIWTGEGVEPDAGRWNSEEPRPTVGCWNLDVEGVVWIVEGPSDGLSLMAAGIPVVMFNGVSRRAPSNTTENIMEVGRWIAGRSAVVCGDNDTHYSTNYGEEFNQQVSGLLGIGIYRLPEGYNDVAQFLADGGKL